MSETKSETKTKKKTNPLVWLLGAIILVVIIGLRNKNEKLYNENHNSETTVETTVQSLGIGETGILNQSGGTTTILNIDKDSFSEMIKVTQANDKEGFNEMAFAGKLIFATCPVKVLVIDKSSGLVRLRILEGEQKGLTGWCPYEYVK